MIRLKLEDVNFFIR